MDIDTNEQSARKNTFTKIERHLLNKLPIAITPLRFRIFLGYLVLLLLAAYGWQQIATTWRYLLTLLAPAFAVIGALVALKFSVVAVSLLTIVVSLVKILFGFIMMVLKPGILKAIFIPQIVSFAAWVHNKSERLQLYVRSIYKSGKAQIGRIITWWNTQFLLDKVLLSGFIIPLLIIVLIVFVIKKALSIFAVKKISEQIVQKCTKLVLKNFHKIPLVGSLPALLLAKTRKFTRKEDRDDIVDDVKSLGREFDLDN